MYVYIYINVYLYLYIYTHISTFTFSSLSMAFVLISTTVTRDWTFLFWLSSAGSGKHSEEHRWDIASGVIKHGWLENPL